MGEAKRKKNEPTRKIPVIPVRDVAPARSEERPAASITSIYTVKGEKPADLTRMVRARGTRTRTLAIIFGVSALLLLVSLAGLYAFTRGGGKFSGDGVKLAIDSDERVASGGEAAFTVTYENAEPVVLGNVELSMQLPDGFTLKHASPERETETANAWKLGTIASGKGGKVRITGTLIGEVGSVATVTATLSFTPASFNSIFTQTAARSVNVSSSAITLAIEGPLRVLPGKEATYKLAYVNTAEELLGRVRITATYPGGFTVTESVPKPSAGDTTWDLGELGPKGKGEITVRGTFDGDAGELQEIRAAIGLIGSDGAFGKQLETSALILLVNPELTLQLAANGSTDDRAVSLGETLDFLLQYRNNSELEINDLALTATLTSSVVDWDKLKDEKKGKRDGATIVWTREQVPELEKLAPGAGGDIRFSIPLLAAMPSALLTGTPAHATVVAKVLGRSASLKELDGVAIERESNVVTAKVNSTMTLSTEARYMSDQGEKLGSGPLPPVVGLTTAYRISWFLTNTTDELQDAAVVMTLPPSVTWTGANTSYTTGQLLYAPATRTVTWTVGKVAPGVGYSTANAEASFEVSVTPRDADVGSVLTLTDGTVVHAIDAFTGASLTATKEPLTSELPNDPFAQGKGTVQSAVPPANTNAP